MLRDHGCERSRVSRAVARALIPSPRPVKPSPSVVVADTLTGAPTRSPSRPTISSLRPETFGPVATPSTATVKAWRDYAPRYIALPHPSWRNNGWLNKNPWFEAELLPYLRRRVRRVLSS